MNNPIVAQLGRSQIPNNFDQIKRMFNMVRNSGNPQAMFRSLMQNNPQYKQIADVVNQYGGNPKEAFYRVCEQNGINPQDVMNMLK